MLGTVVLETYGDDGEGNVSLLMIVRRVMVEPPAGDGGAPCWWWWSPLPVVVEPRASNAGARR